MAQRPDTGFDMTEDKDKSVPAEHKAVIDAVFPADSGSQNRSKGFKQGVAGKKRDVIPRNQRTKGRPSARIRSLVEHIANGKTYAQAAVAAGFVTPDHPTPDNMAKQVMSRPYAREMLQNIRTETAADHKITRANVIEGLKEAIDMARTMAEPGVMIMGWKEIGKMCGLYEQVKVKIDLTTGGAVLQTKIGSMNDEDLLRLATGEAIDGEFIDVN